MRFDVAAAEGDEDRREGPPEGLPEVPAAAPAVSVLSAEPHPPGEGGAAAAGAAAFQTAAPTNPDADHGWSPQVVRRVQAYGTLAQLSSAMNERAALSYGRLDKAVLVLMGLLALVASGQGTTSLVSAHDEGANPVVADSALRVVSALCSILGAFLAMVVSRLDWASRAKALATRASRYAKMATDINTQLTVAVSLRTDALVFLTEISRLNEELQALTDPLPLRYRRTEVIDSIMSMWGGGPGAVSRREGDLGAGSGGGGGGLGGLPAAPPPLLAAAEGDAAVVMHGALFDSAPTPPPPPPPSSVVVAVAPDPDQDPWRRNRADVLALFGAVPDRPRS